MTELLEGWYPDPLNPDRLRFFDGSKWSDDVHPTVGANQLPTVAGWFPDPLQADRSRHFDGYRWSDDVRTNTSMSRPDVPDQYQTTSPDALCGNNVTDVGFDRAQTGRPKAGSPTGADNGAPPHDKWSGYASRAGSAETHSTDRPSPLPVILGMVAVVVALILGAVAATRFSVDMNQQQVAALTAESSTFVAGAPTLEAKIPDVVGFQVADAERILRNAGYDVTSSARSIPCSGSDSGGWVKYVVTNAGDKVHLTTGCNDYGNASKTGEPTEAPIEGEVGEPPSEPYGGEGNASVMQVQVPPVIGMTYYDARRYLIESDLRLWSWTSPRPPCPLSAAMGWVVMTKPRPGEWVDSQTRMHLDLDCGQGW